MKKVTAWMMIVFLLLLAACGGEAKTAEEVIKQSIQASEELESYSEEMKIDTEMMGMEMTIEATVDITHNPDGLYLEMMMGMAGITMDLETYMVGDEVFMKMFGEWVVVEDEELMGLDSGVIF